ncbi:MAG: sigma-E processing peptidase SpoIIGA [Muribaculaceae bacterium]|nr:sigma-E processing peptidase SpoIIGA [Roseburia sp.]MCM1430598.1 sigma-E processing peptidase SpoIIGA [Muribaculaceae bacterium]MCM1492705.1 sigma-E processing peptidase SpoIIGA [Muribaculaceae bacterium]
MIFIYVFYIDLFLVQNFLMNLAVLSLTYMLCKCQVSLRCLRMGLAALCMTLVSAFFVLFLPGVRWLAVAAVPVMLLFAFGWNGKKDFCIRFLVSLFAIVVLNGVAEAVQNLTGIQAPAFYMALLALPVARTLVGVTRSSLRRQGRLYSVTLFHGSKSVKCLGLFDSGNLLATAAGEPVHIASPGILEELALLNEGEVNLIPFQSLGTREGWIRVFRVEKMQIKDGKSTRTLSDVCLGKAEQELLEGKSYRMILNGAKGVIT